MLPLRPALSCLAAPFLILALSPVGILAADAPRVEKPRPGLLKFQKKVIVDNLSEGCDVADVNKDGKLDLVAGPAWYEAPDFKPRPLREMKASGPGDEFMQTNGDHAFDVNGDGFVDVISGSWFTDTVHWYENPGKEGLERGDLWREHLVSKGHPECEGTLFTDLDGDSIPELLISQWHDHYAVSVIRMKPGVKGSLPEFTSFDIGEHNGHGMGVGDVNGDGRKDVLVQHGWYEAPQDRWSGKWKYHKAFGLDHVSLPFQVTDLNGDGRNDVIIAQAHDYGLMWFEQMPAVDGELQWKRHEIDKSFSQLHCLAWADLDGDGQAELITGKRWRAHADNDPGAADPVCLFRFVWDRKTQSFTRDTISYNDRVGTGMQIQIRDLDGDKKLDIAVAGKSGTYVLFNRGPVARAHAAK